jgi:hypothetical protein
MYKSHIRGRFINLITIIYANSNDKSLHWNIKFV